MTDPNSHIEELCDRWAAAPRREPYWSSAFAVGDAEWLNLIGGDKEDLTPYIESAMEDGPATEDAPKVLRLPQRILLRLWQALSRKNR